MRGVGTKTSFTSAYVAWLSLVWDMLERIDRRALAATCAVEMQPCATNLQIVRLELVLQMGAVARLQSRGLLDPADGGQVARLVEDLQRLLPDACISSARVMRCVRAAQDRVFDEIAALVCDSATVEQQRVS
jgi:hypothetical protein